MHTRTLLLLSIGAALGLASHYGQRFAYKLAVWSFLPLSVRFTARSPSTQIRTPVWYNHSPV